jgi:hypothetical protein
MKKMWASGQMHGGWQQSRSTWLAHVLLTTPITMQFAALIAYLQ